MLGIVLLNQQSIWRNNEGDSNIYRLCPLLCRFVHRKVVEAEIYQSCPLSGV